MNIADKVGFNFVHSRCESNENRFISYTIEDDCSERLCYEDYLNGIYLRISYVPSKDIVTSLSFRAQNVDIYISDRILSGPLSEQDKKELIIKAKAKLFHFKQEFGIEAKLAEYQSAESLKAGLDRL